MKLLEKNKYEKLLNPISQVTINNLFARAVIEKRVSGSIYVDHLNEPKTFYVVHPYGMSLLFGNSNNEEFNYCFKYYALNVNKNRNEHEWMQAFPDSWDTVLNDLFKDYLIHSHSNFWQIEYNVIELNTRVNFKFNSIQYLKLNQNNINEEIEIIRTDKEIFKEMKGSVVPFNFWDSSDDFYNHGIGFSLFYRNKLVSTAYSSFIHDNKLELGIETVPKYREKGFAQLVCAALINYCLENKYEPVWACRLENTGSYKLARKLGFEPVLEIPYYRLSK